MSDRWSTIESDPGVFTELIKNIGVKGVQVEELLTLEDEDLNSFKPIYGLIFLFKWVQQKPDEKRSALIDYDPELYFANQVINDACGTYALLSILMNRAKELDIGDELRNLKDFSMCLSSQDRGWTIGNSDVIRITHNSFARQDPFEVDRDDKHGEKEDAFHFISYVPFNGQLYELDGLQKGPISLGECSEETWLPLAREEIQRRIQLYESSEIRFNLLALVGDKRDLADKELNKLRLIRHYLQKHLGQETIDFQQYTDIDYSTVQNEIQEIIKESPETIQASINELSSSIINMEARIQGEIEKQSKWRLENERRRHNYVPLIFELLQQLAKKNMLDQLFQTAVEEKKKKHEEKKAAKQTQGK